MALWDDLVEGLPEVGYSAWLAPYTAQMPQTFFDAMMRQYRNAYLGYQGEAMRRAAGGVPTLKWRDYLTEFNPRQFYRGLSGYEQGQTHYSPIFRFIG